MQAEPNEVQVGEKTYRIGKLNVFTQFNVVRRLAPAFFAMGKVASTIETDGTKIDDIAALAAMGPVAEAIAGLSDADAEFVLNKCLLVCHLKLDNGTWAPVKAQGAVNLQQDIPLPEVMQLVFAVLRENLGNFFPGPQQQG
jgi:hypothetical protein